MKNFKIQFWLMYLSWFTENSVYLFIYFFGV